MERYKERAQEKNGVLVTDGIGSDLVQGMMTGAGVMIAALIGAWAVSCLVGGVIAAGGPLQLVMGWFRAVSGM